MAVAGAIKTKIKNHPKIIIGCVIGVVIVAGLLAYIITQPSNETANNAEVSTEYNKAAALEQAKKDLAKNPDNVDNNLMVANLTKDQDPAAAKQYYVQAFNKFKEQDNPDVPGKPTVTYWAAAGLAERAGETAQAKQYYEKVVQTADTTDAYERSLVEQSQAKIASIK